jgi:hypothetical protein
MNVTFQIDNCILVELKQLITILLIFCSTLVVGQTTAIPDSNFEQTLINLGLDIVIDGQVLTANIDTLTSLTVSGLNISDLTGIEDFKDLTFLNCHDNQLTSLNVTQNILLTHIYCSQNQLTSIDVTQNIALLIFYCYNNQLTVLDVTQNTSLINLICFNNNLTNIDITKNSALTNLNFSNNRLTSIDVTQNTALTSLWCFRNGLTSLNLTQNTALTGLNCSINDLNCLNIKNGNNSNCDIYSTNNPNLYCIVVDNVVYSTTNWTYIDPQTSFSSNCVNPCAVWIDELSFYPNPTSGKLSISLEDTSSGILSLRNYLGQIIKQIKFNSTKLLYINLDGASGIYFLQIEIGGHIITKKIIKE